MTTVDITMEKIDIAIHPKGPKVCDSPEILPGVVIYSDGAIKSIESYLKKKYRRGYVVRCDGDESVSGCIAKRES